MLNIIMAYLFDLEAAGRSKFTIISYRQHLKDLARFLEGQDVLSLSKEGGSWFDRLTTNHLRTYFAGLQRAEMKASSIRTRATILSCFFNWCVQEGIIERNPMVRIRRPKRECRPRPIFTERELLAMLAAAKRSEKAARNVSILYLLLDTGMRTSELMRLKKQDYDPARSMFTINGKGNKVRSVKMGAHCQAAFETYLESTDGHLWGISIWGFRDMIHDLGKRAGVKANPHKWRHTFANKFLDAGGTIDELQYLLGHSSIETTMIYASYGQQERALRSQVQHSPVDGLF